MMMIIIIVIMRVIMNKFSPDSQKYTSIVEDNVLNQQQYAKPKELDIYEQLQIYEHTCIN